MADAGDVEWRERLRTAISALGKIEEQVLPELRKRELAELREQRSWWTDDGRLRGGEDEGGSEH